MPRLMHFLQFIVIMAYCHNYFALNLGKKTWNFEVLTVGSNSSDESLIKIDLKTVRIQRGVYGVSGTIFVNADIAAGDNCMMEATVYRSATGSSEYKLTPFTMKKQHLYEFFDTFYKDILMSSLSKCSDLPNFKNKFQPPLAKKTYKLNSCNITNDGLPPYMSEGFYKVDIIGSGEANFIIESIVKVENSST